MKARVTDETGAMFVVDLDAFATMAYMPGSSPLATKPTTSTLVAMFKHRSEGQQFTGKAADAIFAAFSKEEPSDDEQADRVRELVAA